MNPALARHPRRHSDSEGEVKAVRLYEYGGPENLKYEDNVPEPALSDDSVLVETSATSVNPIDWKIRSGARQKDFPLKLPAILGKDVSGVVRAVGRNIRSFKPGDRVLALADAPYAELVAVDASKVREFADDIRDGKFLLPVSRWLPLRDAGEAHALAQRGGSGKIILVCRD